MSASAPDSDDDNLPIAQFTKKHKESVAPPDADSDEDNELLINLVKVKPKAGAKVKTPIKSSAAKKSVTKKGSMKKAVPPKKGAKKSPAAKATKGKSPAKKKAMKKTSTRKTKSSREQESSGDKLVTRSGVLYRTKKGEMVQKLLCRWWYAIKWPAKEDLRPAPVSYEALEGYPGVFVCVEGDDIGKLLDVRNKATCPCFTNFANKSSEELKSLLETAFKAQKEALVAHWGENMEEAGKIDRELKWLKTVDPVKADKAATRALAHANMN
eukprot:g8405.t1